MLKSACLIVLMVGATHPALAQVAAPRSTPASASVYAVNAAALASAMTYCSTRHGNLTAGTPGQACFVRARQVLASWGLKQVATDVDARCRDPATYSVCLTPEVGRVVYALNAEFVKQGL